MYALIIVIHVIACALLILIVLIQQGRGGGLIDTFSSAESIFGTKTNTFLVKSTSILAVIFFFTCLSLAFLSIQKSKSLIETNYKPSSEATKNSLMPQVKEEVSKETAAQSAKAPSKTSAATPTATQAQTKPLATAPLPNPNAASQTAPVPVPLKIKSVIPVQASTTQASTSAQQAP
jgi:preprotein translocase subunit SecG